MRAFKFDKEIIKALNTVKEPHFNDILEKINETRKSHSHGMFFWKMSPTTLNKRLKFLIETKAIEKVETSRKNVTYRAVVKQNANWICGTLIGHLNDIFSVLGYRSEKPFYNLIEIIDKLDIERMRKLRRALNDSLEMLDYYMEFKK